MRRSMLFLPGNIPNMLLNGALLGSDGIIIDLEDAVSPDEKDAARLLVCNLMGTLDFRGCEVVIRINSIGTPYWQEDLDAVVPQKPNAIMPPKVNSGDDVHIISAYIEKIEREKGLVPGKIGIVPLLETALGIENAFAIALSDKRVTALYLGAEDLTADLHCKRTRNGGEILYARSRLVNAARAAKIEAYDTPFTAIDDEEGLLADTELAKSLGYSGKTAISPRQIPVINRIFNPSEEDVEYAQSVFRAIENARTRGKGVVSLNGKMIDAPIVERARQVLEAAGLPAGLKNE
ncbi:MAG: CoA ester lyase [Treponema sp.]|nr:CoA ester lyase [Treponema sp.]